MICVAIRDTSCIEWDTKITAALWSISFIAFKHLILKDKSPTARTSSMRRRSGFIVMATEKPNRTRIPDEYVATGASIKSPISEKSTI
jgi:hypothetical protein